MPSISPSDPTYVAELANRARAATDPDALYAAAIGQLGLSPAITAALSPLGQEVFKVAEGVVSNLAGDAAGQLATALLGEVEDIIGPETLAAVEGVVGDIAGEIGSIPVVGQVVSFIMSFVSAVEADRAAAEQSGEAQCQAVLGRYVVGSDYGGKVTPADIFAPDPTMVAAQLAAISDPLNAHHSDVDVFGYPGIPNSALGIAFAAITEDGGPGLSTSGNGFLWDDTIHHADEVLHALLPNQYKTYIPYESSVGIHKDRRTVYKALRTAMGSQNSDKGKALWPIYLDMLAEDWGVHMTAGYAAYMISHFWDDGEKQIVESAAKYGWCASNPQIVCCSQDEWTPVITQIANIVESWKTARNQHPAMMHFTFSPDVVAKIKAQAAAAAQKGGAAGANAEASAAGAAYGQSLELARRARTRAKLIAKGSPIPSDSSASLWNLLAELEGT